MTKIIAIGDIHGKDIWKKIVKKESSADMIVFMGDYFDSFDIPFQEQYDNFLEILKFREQNKNRSTLLLGNHDFHYIFSESYSGYQYAYADVIGRVIEEAIKDKSLIQMCYEDNGLLFTHAGVTNRWAKANSVDLNNIEQSINQLFVDKPSAFRFTPGIKRDNSGDDITQTPIWVRPESLLKDKVDGYKQVVGHTRRRNIDIDSDILCIDVLDYCNQYLIIEDNKISYGEIN